MADCRAGELICSEQELFKINKDSIIFLTPNSFKEVKKEKEKKKSVFCLNNTVDILGFYINKLIGHSSKYRGHDIRVGKVFQNIKIIEDYFYYRIKDVRILLMKQ